MRYNAQHKVESKRRILKAAAQQIRASGPAGVSVANVMSAAGLTHGAFYAHFASKDALVAEAIGAMFADSGERKGGLRDLSTCSDADVPQILRTFVTGYLSASHRDRPERGCPLPILAADMARSDEAARATYVAGMDRMTQRIHEALARMGSERPDADARATVAQLVGALALARATGAGDASDAVLRDSCEAIVEKLAL